jgi:hypothetical protein
MKKINYVDGDATQPQGEGIKFIIHCCNDIGAWGAGFVLALSKRWSKPEEYYRALRHYHLGATQNVQVEDDIYVINMIGQHGVGPDSDGNPPVRYVALMQCLEQVNQDAEHVGASVHCPKFGSDLAGGDWNVIETILKEIMTVPVTVYNFKK